MQRHLPRALELLAERVRFIKDDPSVWNKLVDRVGKDRENALKNPRILTGAAVNYALYGKDNPVRFEIPLDEMRKITSKQ